MKPRAARQRRPKASVAPPSNAPQPQRLQKILASAGLGSRRQCEELILSGRVEVGRRVVTELGAKADPERDPIRVDGVALRMPRRIYLMVHKPSGVLSTNADPAGRPRVIDMLPTDERLFTVGRLDMSSEGLILATNDGELANRLAHPRYGVEKTYVVEVAGTLDHAALTTLRRGVHLAEGIAKPLYVRVKSEHKKSTTLEIVLDEGRNREIRRLLARIGHKVLRLKRVALGPLRLGELPPGGVRPLKRDEVRALRAAAGDRSQGSRQARRAKAAGSRSTSATSRRGGTGRPTPGGSQRPKKKAAQFGTVIGGDRGA
jgi:23S rRNA pseudouridine2605 synthase